MATHWYCGHCLYGPMMMATSDHCVICFRQRDNYATYEQYDQSSIASTAPPNQLDPSSGETKCSERDPIVCQYGPELLAGMPAEDLTSAPSRWFCCQCGDGPKNSKTEVKCLACDHGLCARCDKA